MFLFQTAGLVPLSSSRVPTVGASVHRPNVTIGTIVVMARMSLIAVSTSWTTNELVTFCINHPDTGLPVYLENMYNSKEPFENGISDCSKAYLRIAKLSFLHVGKSDRSPYWPARGR